MDSQRRQCPTQSHARKKTALLTCRARLSARGERERRKHDAAGSWAARRGEQAAQKAKRSRAADQQAEESWSTWLRRAKIKEGKMKTFSIFQTNFHTTFECKFKSI
jgi:hypothetical protein